MSSPNPKVDAYLIDGCGRCSLGGTPQCKVHNWDEELKILRAIILECDLTEELKWKVPCYTFEGKNVLILAAFKEYCAISFLKGSLLKDTENILSTPGEHTQSARLIKFTTTEEIIRKESFIKEYIEEAINLEKVGEKVNFKEKTEINLPQEFRNMLDNLPELRSAFFSLTPGRQRGYMLYFSAPKQSATRELRIEKCIQQIMEGKGMHD